MGFRGTLGDFLMNMLSDLHEILRVEGRSLAESSQNIGVTHAYTCLPRSRRIGRVMHLFRLADVNVL